MRCSLPSVGYPQSKPWLHNRPAESRFTYLPVDAARQINTTAVGMILRSTGVHKNLTFYDPHPHMSDNSTKPLVGILMGSKSDWETMQASAKLLTEFGVPNEAKVASAHRSPQLVTDYVTTAEKRGLEIIIAAAGLAAHLPGVVAAQTLLPVLGVP